MKIIINKSCGWLEFSQKALKMYAERVENFTFHSKKDNGYTVYWLEKDDLEIEHESLRTCTTMIEIVEELGEEAGALYSNPKIVEIPDDVEWLIEDYYDGWERVAEKHRTWE